MSSDRFTDRAGTEAVLRRNNVRVLGRSDGPSLVLVQGFGCDQVIWDRMLPYFTDHYRVILLDHVGTGGADPADDPARYSDLNGYLVDLLGVLEMLDLQDATVLGHSIAGAMAVAAAALSPRIGRLVLLCSSACYLNDGDYAGGFDQEDVENILRTAEANYPLWAAAMAPGIAGVEKDSELSSELAERICRLDPAHVRDFLAMSFGADIREQLPEVAAPALILRTREDPLTPEAASVYLHRHLRGSTLVTLDTVGNMPHLNSPEPTAQAILKYFESETP